MRNQNQTSNECQNEKQINQKIEMQIGQRKFHGKNGKSRTSSLLLMAMFSVLSALAANPAHAHGYKSPSQPADPSAQLKLGEPTYKGSGCGEGAASATLSPDQLSLSIIFDDFSAYAVGKRRADTSACRIRVPIEVPKGYRLEVVQLDYRGFASAQDHSAARLMTETRFYPEGKRSKSWLKFRGKKTFKSGFEDNFELTSKVKGPRHSSCGGKYVMESTTRLDAATGKRKGEALIMLDSIDAVATPLQVGVRLKKCS